MTGNTSTNLPGAEPTARARAGVASALWRCMRPRQWTKNALLFSGLFLNARFDRQ